MGAGFQAAAAYPGTKYGGRVGGKTEYLPEPKAQMSIAVVFVIRTSSGKFLTLFYSKVHDRNLNLT